MATETDRLIERALALRHRAKKLDKQTERVMRNGGSMTIIQSACEAHDAELEAWERDARAYYQRRLAEGAFDEEGPTDDE